jgi:hypothetical protein
MERTTATRTVAFVSGALSWLLITIPETVQVWSGSISLLWAVGVWWQHGSKVRHAKRKHESFRCMGVTYPARMARAAACHCTYRQWLTGNGGPNVAPGHPWTASLSVLTAGPMRTHRDCRSQLCSIAVRRTTHTAKRPGAARMADGCTNSNRLRQVPKNT